MHMGIPTTIISSFVCADSFQTWNSYIFINHTEKNILNNERMRHRALDWHLWSDKWEDVHYVEFWLDMNGVKERLMMIDGRQIIFDIIWTRKLYKISVVVSKFSMRSSSIHCAVSSNLWYSTFPFRWRWETLFYNLSKKDLLFLSRSLTVY